MSALVATDLDQTLVYSRAAVERHGGRVAEHVAVERYQGRDSSWMTRRAVAAFAGLPERAVVVPVTTRTPEQWQRIRLPGPPPRHVIAANGGVLLVDGTVDAAWTAGVAARVAQVAPLAEIRRHVDLHCRPEWTRTVRTACDLFCYAVLHRDLVPMEFVARTSAWAAQRGWRVSLQGRKLYWVPAPLTKAAAVAEVARRCGTDTVLAAGDSLLDTDLLAGADRGIAARHGELVASGWHAAHVTVTRACGVLAGEQIVDWFTAALGSPPVTG